MGYSGKGHDKSGPLVLGPSDQFTPSPSLTVTTHIPAIVVRIKVVLCKRLDIRRRLN